MNFEALDIVIYDEKDPTPEPVQEAHAAHVFQNDTVRQLDGISKVGLSLLVLAAIVGVMGLGRRAHKQDMAIKTLPEELPPS